MSLKKLSKEEIEQMSYTDITYLLIKENKKAMNTAELFKKICDLLDLTDEDFSEKIGDYYTSLTIDKRFYMLEGAVWDLTENHKVELALDDDDEITDDSDEEELEDENDDQNVEDVDSDIDDVDDDTLDLSIVSEDELDEEN